MIAQQLSSELESKTVRCPACHSKLECFFQKRSTIRGNEREIIHGPGIFRIYHSRISCLLRFEIFGESGTEENAWEQARTAVSNTKTQ